MPEFAYTAVDGGGRRVDGSAVAESETALTEALRAQGQFLVRLRAAEPGTIDLSQIRVLERFNRRDLIFFTSQLSTVMATGVNLVEGLQNIEDQIEKVVVKRVIASVRRSIESGLSLSDALARHPKVFNDMYLNIVRAGEATGRADRALEDLVKQLEWQDALVARVKEITTYPIIVIVMLIALVTVLVGFTIPRFVRVYQGLSAQLQLPIPTRVVLGVATFFTTYWLVLLLAVAAGLIALQLQWQTETGALTMSRWSLRIPVLGELRRKLAFSRFAHFFGAFHEAGLEVAPSMALTENLIGNRYLARQFHRAVERVMAGESMSRALRLVGDFPPVVIQMIALGEGTGQMRRALEDVRLYFDREIERTVQRVSTLFGPIMLLLLASVFALMALAFYLPLFNMLRAVR
jgi:type IV pilus assembly protein PilC